MADLVARDSPGAHGGAPSNRHAISDRARACSSGENRRPRAEVTTCCNPEAGTSRNTCYERNENDCLRAPPCRHCRRLVPVSTPRG